MRQYALWNPLRAAVVVLFVGALVFGLPGGVLVAQELDDETRNKEAGVTASQGEDLDNSPADETANSPLATIEDEQPKPKTYADAPQESVTVVPVVANEKAQPRDIIKKELTLTNHTDTRRSVYISVRNIDPETGDQVFEGPTESDLSVSLANWLEITRGVIELGPGESRKIPYLIHVNLSAEPGSYFARIGFHEGSTRNQARASETNTELILNVEVESDAREHLQLGTFTSEKNVVLGGSVGFSYMLENIGNRMVEPRGSIRIFNRRGEEVGSIPVNAGGEAITPENKRQLAAVWETSGRFGKYKAFLDLEYGEEQLASVQDTLYFWVFPWKEVFVAMIGVLVLAILGTVIVHMRAVARPRPAYALAEPLPSQAAAYTPETAPQPQRALQLDRSAPAPQGGEVVLAPRARQARKTATPQTHTPAPTAAAPRRPVAQVSGDTVSLAPRR